MGNCNNCGKFGRMKSNCWTLEANKSKCPNGYRGTTDQVAAAVMTTDDDNDIEYVMCGMMNDTLMDEFVMINEEVDLYEMSL
jgi:hypothetical protein